MAFDVSALTNYTIQNKDLLVSKSMFLAKSQMIITKEGNLQTGIKSSEKVNILATDAIFQQGGSCGFNSSGSTTFTQRDLIVGKFKVNESLCPKTLESKYTQLALLPGSRNEKIPFEQKYTDLKSTTIAEQLEIATWQGDTGSGNVNLNKFDGFIKQIDDAAASANGNPTGITVATGITSSNVRTIIGQVIQALPVRIKGKKDVRIFCGWDVFSLFVDKLVNDNLYHYAPVGTENNEEDGEIRIPGTSYLLTAVHGLDGTSRIFGIRMSNMFIGVDLENEEERWELFFAKEADEVRFVAEWKYGVQVAFPAEIVSFKLVP